MGGVRKGAGGGLLCINPFTAMMSLENGQKSEKYETLKPFCIVFRTGV